MSFNEKTKVADITFFTLADEQIKNQGNAMLEKMKYAGVTSIVFPGEDNEVKLEGLTIENLAKAVFKASGTDKASIDENTETISITDMKVKAGGYVFEGFTVNFDFAIEDNQ